MINVDEALEEVADKYLDEENKKEFLKKDKFCEGVEFLKEKLKKAENSDAEEYWERYPDFRHAYKVGYCSSMCYSEFSSPAAAHLLLFLLRVKLIDKKPEFNEGALCSGLGLSLCELGLLDEVDKKRSTCFMKIAARLEQDKEDYRAWPRTRAVIDKVNSSMSAF